MSDDNKTNVGCVGCLWPLWILALLWALAYGITVGDSHYELQGCSCDRGVEFSR